MLQNSSNYKSTIGILTSGGDCPGLNAAIRAIVKPAVNKYDMKVFGILDGFRGLVENRTIDLTDASVSGILTMGGTVLGTSRDKPTKMSMGGEKMDMTPVILENIKKMGLDCLVCLGGGGTQKNAFHLYKNGGVNVLTLPKTIDNDIAKTDITFGFDTAMQIATEAIDRLHSTASSHQRVMVCEVMGHKAGWLALGAGIAGGADVILIPEIPYTMDAIAKTITERRKRGKRFSIVVVAEGAVSQQEVSMEYEEKETKKKELLKKLKKADLPVIEEPLSNRIARKIEKLTGLETRVTTLGHIQRGGVPSAADRLLATQLGAAAARFLAEKKYNVMVGIQNRKAVAVNIEEVAGMKKLVSPNDPLVLTVRSSGASMGDC